MGLGTAAPTSTISFCFGSKLADESSAISHQTPPDSLRSGPSGDPAARCGSESSYEPADPVAGRPDGRTALLGHPRSQAGTATTA